MKTQNVRRVGVQYAYAAVLYSVVYADHTDRLPTYLLTNLLFVQLRSVT